MAQNALTVTPPNPTPPTNMSCTGATPPNPPNFTKNTYADWLPDTDFDTAPPPYFDDGAAGALQTFAANTAALASGSGATAGGTEGTYPGATNGVVPASGSVAHEGAGTEVTVLAPGNITHTYPGGGTNDMSRASSCLGNYTLTPNAQHASSLSPATNPTIASISPNNIASGVGTQAITVTGANFTKQSVINVNGTDLATTFVSSTSLTATATKKATAGTLPYYVKTGGVVQTAPLNWTFT